MKKIASALVLLSLVIGVFLPVIALAQVKECCKLRRSVEYKDITYEEDNWIAARIMSADDCDDNPAINTACTDLINPPGDKTAESNCYTDEWGTICLLNSVNRIFDWTFIIILALVGIMIIVGAFMIITAGGDPGKVGSGRNWILYAVAGMIVFLFARAIPSIARAIMGM